MMSGGSKPELPPSSPSGGSNVELPPSIIGVAMMLRHRRTHLSHVALSSPFATTKSRKAINSATSILPACFLAIAEAFRIHARYPLSSATSWPAAACLTQRSSLMATTADCPYLFASGLRDCAWAVYFASQRATAFIRFAIVSLPISRGRRRGGRRRWRDSSSSPEP